MFPNRTYLFTLLLTCLAIPTLAEESLKATRLQDAQALIERYFTLEESRDYQRAYNLLSATSRRAWMQDHEVESGRGYKKHREIQRLRWENAKIKRMTFDSQLNVIAEVTAKYEQHIYGEHVVFGNVGLVVVVVWENDKPFIEMVLLSTVH